MGSGGELPLVSIVTPSFNQGGFIERTILSVLRQDYPNIEYIVMDALSNDGTAEVLNRYRNEISLVVQEKDDGQADAINKGFARSKGSIMAYLNADDIYAGPHVVRDAVEALQKSAADLVYGRRYVINPEGFYHYSYPFREFDAELLRKADFVPQECTFWTRDIYDRAGGFVNADFRFAMDYELWYRFLDAGARFEAVDSPYGYFRWHPDQKSLAQFRSVGLPEIAKLQEKYADRVYGNAEMQALTLSYWFQCDVTKYPQPYWAAVRLWETHVDFLKSAFADTPIDLWVFGQKSGTLASTGA